MRPAMNPRASCVDLLGNLLALIVSQRVVAEDDFVVLRQNESHAVLSGRENASDASIAAIYDINNPPNKSVEVNGRGGVVFSCFHRLLGMLADIVTSFARRCR
jgi:hypothetical protein